MVVTRSMVDCSIVSLSPAFFWNPSNDAAYQSFYLCAVLSLRQRLDVFWSETRGSSSSRSIVISKPFPLHPQNQTVECPTVCEPIFLTLSSPLQNPLLRSQSPAIPFTQSQQQYSTFTHFPKTHSFPKLEPIFQTHLQAINTRSHEINVLFVWYIPRLPSLYLLFSLFFNSLLHLLSLEDSHRKLAIQLPGPSSIKNKVWTEKKRPRPSRPHSQRNPKHLQQPNR